MKKDPSIHIKKSDFLEILENLEVKNFPIDQFLQLATRKAVNSRVVLVTNDKVHKEVRKILLATKGDASLVADLIYSIRIKLRHRGVRKITQSQTREWGSCKKLAEVCNNFCKEFGFENPREGFLVYLEIGLRRITSSKNLIEKLITLSEYTNDVYQYRIELKHDPTPDDTKIIHDYYVNTIASNTGIVENYTDQVEKYIHFFRLKNFLEVRDWNYKDFIDAQFEALSYCNGIPPLESLHGDKAIERYNKWLYKNHTSQQVDEVPKIRGSLWDSIKNK